MLRTASKMTGLVRAISAAALIGISVFANRSFGQEIGQMGTTALKDEVTTLIKGKKYIDARPYLEELLKRLAEVTDQKIQDELHELYYFYGFGFLQEYGTDSTKPELLKKAIENFDKVITKYPNTLTAIHSIQAKANCYDVLRKPEESARTRELLLKSPFVEKFNFAEQNKVIRKIAESYHSVKKWEDSKKWFEQLFERSKNLDDKVYAASGLVQYMAHKKDVKGINKYLKEMVYRVPSRYDIELNLSLLSAGDELAKKDNYGMASLLYGMVFGKKTIENYYDETIKNLKSRLESVKARYPNSPQIKEISDSIAFFEFKRKLVESVRDFDADLMIRVANNYNSTSRDYESFWAYLRLIREFHDHSSIQDLYISAFNCAYKIGKRDSMFEIGQEYLKEFPDGNYVEDVKFFTARYYLDKGDKDTFLAQAEEFIARYNEESRYCPDMVFLMGSMWMDDQNYDALLKTFASYLKKYPDTGVIEGSLYWSGLANFSMGKFDKAYNFFDRMLREYPMGVYTEDALYRKGVAAFGLGKFQDSADALELFVKNYPDSSLRGEVEFFLGDIYGGAGQEDKAMNHYMSVEKYTKNRSFIDRSYIQAGKLLHFLEKYKEEVALMDSYLKKFPDGICTEAIYNKAMALEKMGLPADALELYTAAIEKYGSDKKDDGVDRLILDFNRLGAENKVKTEASIKFLESCLTDKELLRNMVEKPALRYRHFQANPNIDNLLYERFKRDPNFSVNLYEDKTNINALLDQYRGQLKKYPSSTEDVFRKILQKAQKDGDVTLTNRIMMGLDALGKPVAVNKMFDDSDMRKSSVRSLVWIGKVNEKYGADAARKAYYEAESREEVEYLIDVLFAEAELEESESNWDKVLEIYRSIENNFPSDERSSRAAVSQADVLVKLGKRDQAKKKYEEILQTPSWRNLVFAEVLCKLGDLAASEKKIDEAIMMYERCYLGYSNAYNWTGKALLKAARLLVTNNRSKEAIAACDDFLGDAKNKASPEYENIRTYRQSL